MSLRIPSSFVLVLALGSAAVAAVGASDAPPPVPRVSVYQFGLLRKGPAWTARRTPVTDNIQAGHMANIQRMAAEGLLVAAGPFLDDGDLRGVLIFRADSAAQVHPLVARDPAIQSLRLVLDLFAWQAPTGIGEPYRRLAKQPGFRDSMIMRPLGLLGRGPKWTERDTPESRALQASHARGIQLGLASGELAAAGPCSGGGDLREVLVYDADSIAARRKALEDPAVQS